MPEEEKPIDKKKQRRREQAINHKETEGVDINYQEKQRREKHQPRDTA